MRHHKTRNHVAIGTMAVEEAEDFGPPLIYDEEIILIFLGLTSLFAEVLDGVAVESQPIFQTKMLFDVLLVEN